MAVQEEGACQVSNGNGTFDPRLAWLRLGTRGKVALGCLVLALLVFGAVVPGLVRAVLAPSAETQSNAEGDVASAQKNAERFAGYLAQIDGRSLFIVPGPPVKEVSKEPEPTEEVGEPPKPTAYGGPSIIAMMNDAVWFDNGKRLKAGGERDGDLRVVSVNIPWEATLEWQAVEFKVGLFSRDNLVIKKGEDKSSAEPPAAAADSPGEMDDATDANKPASGDGAPAKPEDVKPSDVKPGEAPAGEPKAPEPKPGDVKPPDSGTGGPSGAPAVAPAPPPSPPESSTPPASPAKGT